MRVNLKISWLVFASALMTLLLFGLADAQDGSLDQVDIEKALWDALPKEGDLPADHKWNSDDIQSSSSAIDQPINVIVRTTWETDQTNWETPNHEVGSQWFSIFVDCRANAMYKSPSEFRSWVLSPNRPMVNSGKEGIILPYEPLPGAFVIEAVDYNEGGGVLDQLRYQVFFWKDPYYCCSVTTQITTSCLYLCRQEHEKVLPEARSECERLAKLVYDRLPGGDVAREPVPTGTEDGNLAGSQVQSFREEAQAKMKELEGEEPESFENLPLQDFIGISGVGKSIIQQVLFQRKLREYQEYGMHGYSLLITDEPSLASDDSLTALRHKTIYSPKMKNAFDKGTQEGYRQVIDLFYKAMEEDVTTATKRHESESKKSRTDEDKEDAVQNAPAARKYINERGEETYKPAPVK